MDVVVKPDRNAKQMTTVTDNLLASRADALIRAKHCLVELTLTVNRKSTLLGADACPVSRKIARQARVFLSAKISCAEKMPSASSHPPHPWAELRPLALVWKATTAIHSQADLALRTSVQPLYPVRSPKFAFLVGVRSAAKESLAE